MNDRLSTSKKLNPLLRLAALAGVQVAIRHHIRRGDDLDAIDSKGRSPLILAASRGHIEICRILLDAGASFQLIDSDGNTALSIAETIGRNDLVELLGKYQLSFIHACENKKEHQHAPESNTLLTIDNDVFIESDDFQIWEVDEIPLPPKVDEKCVASASEVQFGISSHIPIDTDKDWSEVVLDLPNIEKSRRRKNSFDDEERNALHNLFLTGVRDGCLTQQKIYELIIREPPVSD